MEENSNFKSELNIDKKIKTRKIGRFTFGIVLILTGVLVFVQTFTTIDTLRYIMMLSPLIFISLGLEVLLLSRKNDIKFDFAGVILTFLTLGAGWIFAGINYGVNKVLYDNKIVSVLSQNPIYDTSTYYFDDIINLSNLSNKEIDLEILETNEVEGTMVYIKYNYKNNIEDDNVIEYLINSNQCCNNIIKNVDYENNLVMFIDIDEDVENIQLKVITNDKDNVKYEGNFNEIK